MVPDAAQWMKPASSEYQTRRAGASLSTFPPSLTTERADKSEQTPELPKKDRQASLSPRLKSKSSTRGRLRWNELDDTDTEAKGSSTNDEQKAHSSRTSSRRSRSKRIMQFAPRAESSSSSSCESSIHEHTRPRHILKPPKYDGTSSFETFFAQFQNCALHNKWTKKEQLVYLRSSLEKDAGLVFWDYGGETTASLSKMMEVLKER